jgi:2,5-diamino-6-(ribosylamino)-4(3H)-pyrimidinone 5'-phosphate reductase
MYKLNLPTSHEAYVIANFAITLDGKVAGTRSPYWPIASRLDYQVVEELRAQVDVLIHGKNTALEHAHAKYVSSSAFNELRSKYGMIEPYVYIVVSGHPDTELLEHLSQSKEARTILVTTDEAELPVDTEVEIWRCGSKQVSVTQLRQLLSLAGLNRSLVEGGPTLFGSLLSGNLIDELFVTIAPKLVGSGKMLSLIEGVEFLPKDVKKLKLLQVQQVGDELYLRYKVNR